jgi:hypothetical protein
MGGGTHWGRWSNRRLQGECKVRLNQRLVGNTREKTEVGDEEARGVCQR